MVIGNNYFNNINKITNPQTNPVKQNDAKSNGEFGKILQDKLNPDTSVKFSKHAEFRLQSRNIQLSPQQKDKINQAVKKAEEKGVKDSLVLMDNMAFVVNVKNKTVVTAVNSDELKSNVFTNIDGAVIA